MTKNVKFYWWASCKTWKVSGKDMDDIMNKCDDLCWKYHAVHYEIL